VPDDTSQTPKDKHLDDHQEKPAADYEYRPVDQDITAEHVSLAAIEAESGGIEDTNVTNADSAPDREVVQQSRSPHVAIQTAEQSTKKSRKGLLIAIISTLVVLVLGGGGFTAYAWYQNPEKVVTDGIVGAIQAKSTIAAGEFELNGDSYAVKVTYDTRTSYEAGSAGAATLSIKMDDAAEMKLSGEAMYTSAGDAYIKAKDIIKVYDSYLDEAVASYKKMYAEYGDSLSDANSEQYKTEIDSLYRPLLTKIDNRWIKISADDIKQTNENVGEEYECVQNALEKLTTDKEFAKQFRELYQKHKPLLVDKTQETKGNSIAYIIKENKNTSKAFNDAAANLPAIKTVNECTKSSLSDDGDSNSSSTDSNIKTEVKVWADRWSHALTDFRVTAGSDSDGSGDWSMVLNGQLVFNQPVTIAAPSDAMSLKELQGEIDKIADQFQDLSGSSMSSDADLYDVDDESMAPPSKNSNART